MWKIYGMVKGEVAVRRRRTIKEIMAKYGQPSIINIISAQRI